MSMIDTLLIDVDGVIVHGEYFSKRLAARTGASMEVILPFFKEKFAACVHGQADLREEVLPYLAAWKWTGSVQDLLDFWFSEDTVDGQVLALLDQWRAAGKKAYLATNQEACRADYVLNALGIGAHVDGAFISCELGCKKVEPAFFQQVCDRLGAEPDQIAFLDDEEENVEAARAAGIDGHVFFKLADLEQILG